MQGKNHRYSADLAKNRVTAAASNGQPSSAPLSTRRSTGIRIAIFFKQFFGNCDVDMRGANAGTLKYSLRLIAQMAGYGAVEFELHS